MLHCTSVETTGGNRLVTLRMHAVVTPYECNDVILVVTVCRKTSQYDVNFQRNLDGEKPRFFQFLIKYSIHMHMSNKKQVIEIKVITIILTLVVQNIIVQISIHIFNN